MPGNSSSDYVALATRREEPTGSLTVLLNWYIFVIFPKRSPVPGSLRFAGRVKLRIYVWSGARTRAKPCRPLNRGLIHVNHGNVARREFIWWEVIIGFVARYRSRNEPVSTRAIQSGDAYCYLFYKLYGNLNADLKREQFVPAIFRYSDWR